MKTESQFVQAMRSLALLSIALSPASPVVAAPVDEPEVRQCVQSILQGAAGGSCNSYLSLESVKKIDARSTPTEAFVIAEIIFRVKQRLDGGSRGASECTGSTWRGEVKNPYPPNTAQWLMYQSQADMAGGYLEPGRGLLVRKTFKFERWESGWRCAAREMSPLDGIAFVNTPAARDSPPPSSTKSSRSCSGSSVAQWTNCVGSVKVGKEGATYVGEFSAGKPSGQGTFTHANGNKVVGEFRDGKPNGPGTYTFTNGHKYVGEFSDGKPHGQGIYTMPDGAKYVGDFRAGQRHGQGTLTFPDGGKYVGQWRNHKQDGEGILYASDGTVRYSGMWADGKQVK